MNSKGKNKLTDDTKLTLAYEIEYREKIRDLYDFDIRKHYIQCFGRNPQDDKKIIRHHTIERIYRY